MKFLLHHHDPGVLARRRKWSQMWALLVIVWSLLRTLIVWAAVGDYGLNPWIYLAIDLVAASVDAVTTPRMVLAFVDANYRNAARWAVISLAAFVVPDVYIFAGTQRLPTAMVLVIVAVILVTFLGGIGAVVRRVGATARERDAGPRADEGASRPT